MDFLPPAAQRPGPVRFKALHARHADRHLGVDLHVAAMRSRLCHRPARAGRRRCAAGDHGRTCLRWPSRAVSGRGRPHRCGLSILGFSLPAVHGAHSRFLVPGMIGFEFGLLIVGSLLIAGPRIGAPARHHGFMLGAASGILFGVSDVAIKAISGVVGTHGLTGLLTRGWRSRSSPPWLPSTARPRACRTAMPFR